MDVSTTETPGLDLWRVVVPVKDARVGKSRLAATMADADERVRRAIAQDTVRAVLGAVGAERTFIVTSDPELGPRWASVGATVLPDPGAGLNAAIAAGLAAAAGEGRMLAALLGDLPALRPEDLLRALAAAQEHLQSFVPDHEGSGTVLRCGPMFVPRFGRRSADEHAADGAVRLELDLPALRTDVDDHGSLVLATRLGLGCHTNSALARAGLG